MIQVQAVQKHGSYAIMFSDALCSDARQKLSRILQFDDTLT